ncbi:MAG: hypothetical protein ACYTGX_05355 [Planctomycetota bacterium]
MRTAWGATITICCAALGCAASAPPLVGGSRAESEPLPATRLADDSMDPNFALDPPKESVDKEFALDPPPQIDPDFVTPTIVRPTGPLEGMIVDDGSELDAAMLKAMREQLKDAIPGSMWERFLRRRIADAEKRLREQRRKDGKKK